MHSKIVGPFLPDIVVSAKFSICVPISLNIKTNDTRFDSTTCFPRGGDVVHYLRIVWGLHPNLQNGPFCGFQNLALHLLLWWILAENFQLWTSFLQISTKSTNVIRESAEKGTHVWRNFSPNTHPNGRHIRMPVRHYLPPQAHFHMKLLTETERLV